MNKKFDNEMRIALFEETNKTNEKAPDYKGTLQIDGKEYRVSAWNRSSNAGLQYLSGTIITKEEHEANIAKYKKGNDPFNSMSGTERIELENQLPF